MRIPAFLFAPTSLRNALSRVALGLAVLTACASSAQALIVGDVGNEPVTDPGWPAGAAAVFNSPSRIAYWEGPPFGGGQYHAECRGNTAAFNDVLEAFAKIDSKQKRLIVHDGEGASFWLNMNAEPEKKAAAVVDWIFVVWQPESWSRLQKMPANLRAPEPFEDAEPVPQIDVYVGGRIIWADVVVPRGIEVQDGRLEAHGFTEADGTVLEGTITSLEDKSPLAGRIRLQRMESQLKGGSTAITVSTAEADARGRWVLKNCPEGTFRIVIEADGYLPPIAGHRRFTGEPRWGSVATALSRPAEVSGSVVDADGTPLADVNVRIDNATVGPTATYETPEENALQTDASGRFRTNRLAVGTGTIWIRKEGYVRPGLGLKVQIPSGEHVLTMVKSGQINVTVDRGGRGGGEGYIVKIAPEAGEKVGSWGGSGNIDEEGAIQFKHVPPGRYKLSGRPNPGSDNQETDPIVVDLKGGQTLEVTIQARP